MASISSSLASCDQGVDLIQYSLVISLFTHHSFNIDVVIMSIQNFRIPPKVPHRNRVFNGEEKHTLLDPFTVIPTWQFSPIAGDFRSPITAIGENLISKKND